MRHWEESDGVRNLDVVLGLGWKIALILSAIRFIFFHGYSQPVQAQPVQSLKDSIAVRIVDMPARLLDALSQTHDAHVRLVNVLPSVIGLASEIVFAAAIFIFRKQIIALFQSASGMGAPFSAPAFVAISGLISAVIVQLADVFEDQAYIFAAMTFVLALLPVTAIFFSHMWQRIAMVIALDAVIIASFWAIIRFGAYARENKAGALEWHSNMEWFQHNICTIEPSKWMMAVPILLLFIISALAVVIRGAKAT